MLFTVIWRRIYCKTTQIVREETRYRHIGYSFRLAVFYMHHLTDRITHTTIFDTSVVEQFFETRNSSMGPPWRMDQTTHRTMNELFYSGATTSHRSLDLFLSRHRHANSAPVDIVTTASISVNNQQLVLKVFLRQLSICPKRRRNLFLQTRNLKFQEGRVTHWRINTAFGRHVMSFRRRTHQSEMQETPARFEASWISVNDGRSLII